jgi:hypothetical protein
MVNWIGFYDANFPVLPNRMNFKPKSFSKSHPIPLITTRSPQASIFQKHFTSEKIIKRMLRWINCLWHVHLKWGMSVANIIKNAYLIVIMSLNDLSVVNKTKKRPPFSVLKIKCCSSYTEYRNEIGCFTNFNMYHSWWHSPFFEKKGYYDKKTIFIRDIPRLPLSKITTFGCEKENVRGIYISGCD